MKTHAKLESSWIIIINRSIKLLSIKITEPEKSKIYDVLHLLQKWSICMGGKGVKKWKNISDYLIRWIMLGKPDEEHSCYRKRKGKVRVPRKFSWVFSITKRNGLRGKTFVFTILSLHRLVRTRPSYDVSTIVNPSIFGWRTFFKFKEEFKSIPLETYVKRKCGPFTVENLQWPLKERAGVTGTPSWKYYREELEVILNSNLKYPWLFLYSSWISRLEKEPMRIFWKDLLGNISPRYWGKGFWAFWVPALRWGPKSIHSRLAFLSDKSGKTRIVAIGDVWSQLVLKPYHDHVFRFLKTLSSDGTFDQDKQRERIKRWTKDKRLKLHCFDLTAATDRIPCTLQGWLLYRAGIILTIPELIAWYWLMARRDFHFTVKKGKNKSRWAHKVVRYAVGQPMGLYSSWAALAFFHHSIVWLAAKRAGYKQPMRFTKYSIVGDDIVIGNTKVAENYKQICEELGVSINLSKSYIGYGYAEYMKTLFVEGNIVSTLPLESLRLREAYRVEDTLIILEDLHKRGINLTLEDFMDCLDRKRINSVYMAITCPDNPVYYPTELWGFQGVCKEYAAGYLQFLRSIKALDSIGSSNQSNRHDLVGTDPNLNIACTPTSQEATRRHRQRTRAGLVSLKGPIIKGIGEGFTFWTFGPGEGFNHVRPNAFPLDIPPNDRKKSSLDLKRLNLQSGMKVKFGKSLGLDGDHIQAVDYLLNKDRLPIPRRLSR